VSDVGIRTATASDVPALNAIYNEYIVGSHVSFDADPWTDDERLAWFDQRVALGYPILVAVINGVVVGSAWSGPWRDKAAYRSSVETTVVVAPGHEGAGIGSALMVGLLDVLAEAGFVLAIAIVALPNDGSIAAHQNLGYTEVGVLRDVGFKDGRFHDTMILQRQIAPEA